MTIKRRLFISNILMFVLPPMLIWIVSFGIGIFVFGIPGMGFYRSHADQQRIMESILTTDRGIAVAAIMFTLMIFSIAAVNLVLTRNLIKRIMAPLDTLASGVRQIGGNNLSFRLDYRSDDEFRPVCDTFNEMASQLETMIKERQKNEDNRRELIAGISHDLRTPLTSIKMGINGIKTGVAASAEQREKYFGIIENKSDDLEHIIDQLFLFSKLDMDEFTAQTQTVDCGSMLEDCIEELSDEYEKRGLALAAGVLPQDIHISIDPVLFRRVIVNILENAVKYKTAEKGRMLITAAQKMKSGEESSVEICLADDGPGVNPESLEKLFDVFYRADPSRKKKGSGLGLA
ncbi:MAG: HAMP domain-containing histidine kinase, partial [Treponema sp.]|nr:HAMP domain-containing histidine kinase [Treponema sp.]